MAKFLTDKKLAGSILLVILLWISAILWNFDISIGRFNINWLYFVFFKLLPALGILYIFLAFLLKTPASVKKVIFCPSRSTLSS